MSAKASRSGPGQLERHPRRRAGLEQPGHRLGDVVELDDVDRPGLGGAREDRQRGEGAEQGAAAISRRARPPPRGEGSTQSSPLAASAASPSRLRPREIGEPAAVDAERREMDDPPHARRLAGAPQRQRHVAVDPARRIAAAVLEHAGAIHDGVDAGEMGQPGLGGSWPGAGRASPSGRPAPAAPPDRRRGRRRRSHGRRARAGRRRPSRSGRSPRAGGCASPP